MGCCRCVNAYSERKKKKKALCTPSQLLVWHKIRSKSVVIRRGEDLVFQVLIRVLFNGAGRKTFQASFR